MSLIVFEYSFCNLIIRSDNQRLSLFETRDLTFPKSNGRIYTNYKSQCNNEFYGAEFFVNSVFLFLSIVNCRYFRKVAVVRDLKAFVGSIVILLYFILADLDYFLPIPAPSIVK